MADSQPEKKKLIPAVLRIAVADDELDMRSYFAKVLPRLGHEVVGIVENGKELVDLCRRELPDLIISDVRMPEMGGDQAISEICSQVPCPFIVVSAFAPLEHASFDRHRVPWCCLSKPITRLDLEAAITTVAGQRCPPENGPQPN